MGRYIPLAEAAVTGVENDVTVHRPGFTLLPAVGGPINPRMIVRAILPLAQRLHAMAPFDLVDAQFFYPDGPSAARVAYELGLPLSIKARGADIGHWGHKHYALRRMKAAAEQAKGLLAVSEALKREMVALGLPARKITVHYTGLDHSLFHPLGRARSRRRLADEFHLALPTGSWLIVTVGALIPRKGQHFAIRALAQLPDTHLALVGQGPGRELLEDLARDLGLQQRVHFLGTLDHARLPCVLSAADAMVLPSSSEGLANAWIEALACGTPVVITDTGGAREVVTSNVAGRIVPRDATAIAEGLREVFAQQAAPEDVAATTSRFSWEANAEALARYYERLIRN
jgi:glycosyltransferase involved in cell wall biosynthesis